MGLSSLHWGLSMDYMMMQSIFNYVYNIWMVLF